MDRFYNEIVIGVMSGTSNDGIDLAACGFQKNNHGYEFQLLASAFFKYDDVWKNRLNAVREKDAEFLFETDVALGNLIAKHVLEFQDKNDFAAQIISSHGHTIFHNPNQGYSVQIGCGATIAAKTGIKTVNNFRQLDVALGGQGAPLVPIGDRFLFGDFDACLNIGGFANISYESQGKRLAFDISPANRVLNQWSQILGFEFDESGKLGKQGHVNQNQLETWNNLSYYQKEKPKSLSEEWLNGHFYPNISKDLSTIDLLATAYAHMGVQIGKVISEQKFQNCLITGGGAYNEYLLEKIKSEAPYCKLILPDKKIIDFKESIIFAFLGWLRVNKAHNTLIEATGASATCSSGVIWEV